MVESQPWCSATHITSRGVNLLPNRAVIHHMNDHLADKTVFWFLALILVVTRITTVIAGHLSIRHQSRHGKRGSFRYLLLSLLLSILGLIPDSTLRPRRRATVISGGTRAFGPLQSPLRRRRRPEPLRRRPPHCCCGYGWGNCPGKLQWGGGGPWNPQPKNCCGGGPIGGCITD